MSSKRQETSLGAIISVVNLVGNFEAYSEVLTKQGNVISECVKLLKGILASPSNTYADASWDLDEPVAIIVKLAKKRRTQGFSWTCLTPLGIHRGQVREGRLQVHRTRIRRVVAPGFRQGQVYGDEVDTGYGSRGQCQSQAVSSHLLRKLFPHRKKEEWYAVAKKTKKTSKNERNPNKVEIPTWYKSKKGKSGAGSRGRKNQALKKDRSAASAPRSKSAPEKEVK